MKLDMSMKLSSKDKKMIIVALIFAFVFAAYTYLIKPEMDRSAEIIKQNVPITVTYNLAINKTGVSDAIEKTYLSYSQKLNSLLNKKISPYMADEEIDKYFTDLSNRFGLKPINLIIEHPQNTKDNKNVQPLKYVEQVYVTLGENGDIANCSNMISEIDKIDYLSVLSINMKRAEALYENEVKVQLIMLKAVPS